MTALDRLTSVERADVWKGGRRAGHLVRADGGTVFDYAPDFDGQDVATTLPRAGAPFRAPAGAVPPFFAGLLPEGRRLSALWRAIKTSADDELSLLLAVGADPIGDVQVVPEGDAPSVPPTPPLEGLSFAEVFARVLGPDPVDRVGLPGVQDKVSGRLISLPLSWGDGASILKLSPPEFPGLVENEAFFLEAARRSGLEVAEARILTDRDGHAGLLVRRFDRRGSGPRERRLAQEDGCQVLGLYPADKYRPAAEEVVRGLAAVCDAAPVAARTFLQQLAFAYLSCNGDVHAKNLSVLQRPDGEWRASPAYDLPSTHPYGDVTLALTVNGKRREDVGRADFVALGRAVGVPEKATHRVLDALVEATGRWLPELDTLPFDERRIHKLGRVIAWRRDRLAG